jgi:hypothetical protein
MYVFLPGPPGPPREFNDVIVERLDSRESRPLMPVPTAEKVVAWIFGETPTLNERGLSPDLLWAEAIHAL